MRIVIQLVSFMLIALGVIVGVVAVMAMVQSASGDGRENYGPFTPFLGVAGISAAVGAILLGGIAFMLCEIDSRLEELVRRTPLSPKAPPLP